MVDHDISQLTGGKKQRKVRPGKGKRISGKRKKEEGKNRGREAENGEGIQMSDSRTAKPITLFTYFVKSFNSLLVNRDRNLKDGDAPIFQRAVTLTLLACFAWQLSGLLGLAFDPTRT